MLDSSRQQTMEEINDLLISSIGRYENILTMYETINNNTDDKSPSTLDSRGIKILQLQEEANLADHDLIAIIKDIGPSASTHLAAYSLIKQRQNLMQQILVHNRLLLSAINNIKSLLVHEIKEMQGSRAALKGYRQTTSSHNGGILNDSQ